MDQYIINWTAVVGIVGILGTISVALINNVINLKLQKEKLEFESAQREKERIHLLRKDIYLSAAEQFISIHALIGKLIYPSNSLDDTLEEFNTFCKRMYRLQLVADGDLAELTSNIIKDYSILYTDALKDAKLVTELRSRIEILENLIKTFRNDIFNCLEKIKINILKDKYEPEKNDYLNQEIKILEEKALKIQNEIEILEEQYSKDIKAAGINIFTRSTSLRGKYIKFDILLRKGVFGEEGLIEYEQQLLKIASEAESEKLKFLEFINL